MEDFDKLVVQRDDLQYMFYDPLHSFTLALGNVRLTQLAFQAIKIEVEVVSSNAPEICRLKACLSFLRCHVGYFEIS